ncbi:MAG: hypothetical protein M1480_06120 [Bacteroidetes bacterium]|nr:hypothetical protein [Bacteroidota bacterium]
MKDITEEELHLYILNKTLLDKDILNRIEEIAGKDESFQKELHEIEEFYSNYNQISSNRQNTFFLNAPQLETFRIKSIKLAAMQSVAESTDLTYIKTFFTGDNYLITRLFYNSKDQSYNLFIIPEDDKGDVSNAILYLTGIKKEFLADEKGMIKIKSGFIDFPEQIIIRLPLAKFDIVGNDLIQLQKKSFSFHNKKNDFKLELDLNEKILNGSLQIDKNISNESFKLFIFEPGNESNFTSVNMDENKFSINCPELKSFRIVITEI